MRALLCAVLLTLPSLAHAKSRISKFAPDGTLISRLSLPVGPGQLLTFVDVDGQGRIWWGRASGTQGDMRSEPEDAVFVYDSAGTLIRQLKGGMKSPQSVAFESNGGAFIAAYPDGGALSSRIFHFDPAGVPLAPTGGTGSVFGFWQAISFASGTLYGLYDNTAALRSINPTTGQLGVATTFSGLIGSEMTSSADGNDLWIMTRPNGGPEPISLRKCTGAGVCSAPSVNLATSYATGLRQLSNGTLLVFDSNINHMMGFATTSPSGATLFSTPLDVGSNASCMSTDSAGNYYIGETFTGTLTQTSIIANPPTPGATSTYEFRFTLDQAWAVNEYVTVWFPYADGFGVDGVTGPKMLAGADGGLTIGPPSYGSSFNLTRTGLTTAPAGTTIRFTVDGMVNPALPGVYSLDTLRTSTANGDTIDEAAAPRVGITNAPIATSDDASTAEDTPLEVSCLSNDTDSDGDTLAVIEVGAAMHGTTSGTGSKVAYAPEKDFFGQDSFTYKISDAHGGFAQSTVKVTVTPVNDAPVFVAPTPSGELTVEKGSSVVFTMTATDADGDALTYSVTGAPGAILDSKSGVFSWSPNASATLKLSVTDGTATAESTITVTVAVSDAADAAATSPAPKSGCACGSSPTDSAYVAFFGLVLLVRRARRSRGMA